MRPAVSQFLQFVRMRLAAKGTVHWVVFAAFLMCSLPVAVTIRDSTGGLLIRYWAHEQVTSLAPFERFGDNVVVVYVDDDVFYGADSRAMSPLSPSLIAQMLLKAEAAGTTGVALDFDMRYADPANPSLLGSAFDADVKNLQVAILSAAHRIPVILPVMLNKEGKALEPSYLDSLSSRPANVRFGLVNLPLDVRYLPLGSFDAKSGRFVEGLGVALARSKRSVGPTATLLPSHQTKSPMVSFHRRIIEISAAELLLDDIEPARRKIAGRLLILGGRWNTPTRVDGKIIDTYTTPAGRLGGATIHATYAEAVLSGEVYMPAPEAVIMIFKVVSLVLMGVVMALLDLLRYKVLCVFGTVILQLGFGYLAFTNGGVSFEFAISALFILIHAFGEHVLDWYSRPPRRTEPCPES